MKTMRDWAIGIGVVVGIIAVVLLGLGIGDRVRLNVYLFVDNAGAEPAIVKLEGAAVLTAAPRSVGIVYTRHGDRQIRVERAGQPVFEKEITIDSPGFFGVSKYIVNPKQESGYWVWAIRPSGPRISAAVDMRSSKRGEKRTGHYRRFLPRPRSQFRS